MDTRLSKAIAFTAMASMLMPDPLQAKDLQLGTFTDSLRGRVTHREAKARSKRRNRNRMARKSRQRNRV
jgi:hypothetical protein